MSRSGRHSADMMMSFNGVRDVPNPQELRNDRLATLNDTLQPV